MKKAKPEARARLQKIIRTLTRTQLLTPKRVTLPNKSQPLAKTLQAIRDQTGYRIIVDEKVKRKPHAYNLKNVTFWEAVEKICQQNSSRMIYDTEAEYLKMVPIEKPTTLASLNGRFCVKPIALHDERNHDFTGPDKEDDDFVLLTLHVMVEPSLEIIRISRVEGIEAVDEYGASFLAPKWGDAQDAYKLVENLFLSLRKRVGNTTRVLLRLPNRKSKSINKLKGYVPVLMRVGVREVVVTKNFLNCEGMTIASNGLTLKVVRAEQLKDGDVVLKLEVPEEKEHTTRKWPYRFSLTDAMGNRFKASSWGTASSGFAGETTRTASVWWDRDKNPGLGPPTQLIFEQWELLEYRLPIELKNVPLP